MTNSIQINFQTVASNVDTSYSSPVIIVGQTTTANTGIFTDIEIKSKSEINTLFGAGSHLSMMLREALTVCENNGFTKPKVLAVSYADDVSGDVAKVVKLELTGTTATESKVLKIIFNRHNQSRYSALISTLFSAKVVDNTDLTKYYDTDFLSSGSPKNASYGYVSNLTTIYDNDLTVYVEILKGETINQIAAKINTAINAETNCTFASAVTDGIITLTAKNKGIVSQEYTVELDQLTIPSGVTTSLTQLTAGSGTIDISNILNLTKNNVKLDNMKFKCIAIPYGWNDIALVINAKAKFDNVLNYQNQALDYRIIKTAAVDCSDIANIDTFAINHPKSEEGLNQILFVLNAISNIRNIPTSDKAIADKLDFYNFTGISYDNYNYNSVSLKPVRTLSSKDIFKSLSSVITSSIVREIFVERYIPMYFTGNENYSDGSGDIYLGIYGKKELKSIFLSAFNYFYMGSVESNETATKPATIGSGQFSGMIKNDAKSIKILEDIIDATLSYNTSAKEVRTQLITSLYSQIEKLTIINNIR
jgi:hypothetical protein